MILSRVTPARLWRIASATLQTTSRVPLQGSPVKRAEQQATKLKASHHVQISDNKETLIVAGDNLRNERFHATWLRHVCQCPQCREADNDQRYIDPINLRPSYSIKNVHIQDGDLVVEWNEEDHCGYVPLSFLAKHKCSSAALEKKVQERTPTVCKHGIPRLSYESVIASEKGVWQWVKHLTEEGVCIVQGVPEDQSVKQVIERVVPVQATMYGEIFRVETNPRPENLAFTTVHLPSHMDLVYYDTIPGFQLLLCKRFDDCIIGGENIIIDAWYEAERMRKLHPEQFDTLTRVPVTFRMTHDEMRDIPAIMQTVKPHFTVDNYTGQIERVLWNASTERPLCVREEDIAPYFKAHHTFAKMLDSSDSKMEVRLKEGELLMFNNRRMTHARKAFQQNGGHRLFEGCFVNVDEMKSKAQMLSNKYNDGKPVKYLF